MKFLVQGRPVFYFNLSLEQINLLMKLSSIHYDSVCKSVSQQGGFLNGWKNSIEFNSNDVDPLPYNCKSDFSELDIILKICEGAFALTPVNRDIVMMLSKNIYEMLQQTDDISKNWKAEVEILTKMK